MSGEAVLSPRNPLFSPRKPDVTIDLDRKCPLLKLPLLELAKSHFGTSSAPFFIAFVEEEGRPYAARAFHAKQIEEGFKSVPKVHYYLLKSAQSPLTPLKLNEADPYFVRTDLGNSLAWTVNLLRERPRHLQLRLIQSEIVLSLPLTFFPNLEKAKKVLRRIGMVNPHCSAPLLRLSTYLLETNEKEAKPYFCELFATPKVETSRKRVASLASHKKSSSAPDLPPLSSSPPNSGVWYQPYGLRLNPEQKRRTSGGLDPKQQETDDHHQIVQRLQQFTPPNRSALLALCGICFDEIQELVRQEKEEVRCQELMEAVLWLTAKEPLLMAVEELKEAIQKKKSCSYST